MRIGVQDCFFNCRSNLDQVIIVLWSIDRCVLSGFSYELFRCTRVDCADNCNKKISIQQLVFLKIWKVSINLKDVFHLLPDFRHCQFLVAWHNKTKDLCFIKDLNIDINKNTVFDAVQSPPLSSPPPVKLEESWSLKKISTIFFGKKLCFWIYCEQDLLIFVCFSYLNTMK